jgi:hypothetical protein
MGIFDRLFGERKEGKELERIFEKMKIPSNEVAELKKKNRSKKYTELAELADELVSRERSRAASLEMREGDISPWGTEQIGKMIDILWQMFVDTVSFSQPTIMNLMGQMTSQGSMGRTFFLMYIEKAVEDVIADDLKGASKEDIEEWRSKDW